MAPHAYLRTPARWSAVVALFTLLAFILPATSASAHNSLQSTDPEDGATVETAPGKITLLFDDKVINLGTAIAVIGPDGATMSQGDPLVDHNSVIQPLREELPAGEYEVVWRVTSADGHPIDGSFKFTAENDRGVPEPAETESPATDEPTTEASTTGTATAPGDDDIQGSGLGAGILLAVIVVGALAGVGAVTVVNKRRASRAETSTTDTGNDDDGPADD